MQSTDNYSTNHIIYFELPDTEQISFHTNFEESQFKQRPVYEKEWDGKVNSTLGKIERAILANFNKEIQEKLKSK